jgi:hypothetical protein
MECLWHVSVAEINVNPCSVGKQPAHFSICTGMSVGCKDSIYKFTGMDRTMW